jgi:predicted small secreted protein
MIKVSALLMAVMMVVGISGCETMEGLGRDLGKLGEKIEDKAGSNK